MLEYKPGLFPSWLSRTSLKTRLVFKLTGIYLCSTMLDPHPMNPRSAARAVYQYYYCTLFKASSFRPLFETNTTQQQGQWFVARVPFPYINGLGWGSDAYQLATDTASMLIKLWQRGSTLHNLITSCYSGLQLIFNTQVGWDAKAELLIHTILTKKLYSTVIQKFNYIKVLVTNSTLVPQPQE